MKKIILKSLLLIFVLLVTGCGSGKEENKLKNKIEKSDFGYGDSGLLVDCNELAKATYVSRNYFITNDGRIYRLNFHRFFSNDKNCILSNYQNDDVAFSYGNTLYNKSGYPLAVWKSENNDFIRMEDANWELYSNTKLDIYFDYISYDDCSDTGELYIKDKKVYKEKYENEDVFLGEIPSDEEIVYLDGTLIKTNKNYYIVDIINKEECSKYVDVDCEYKYVRSDLSDIYDDILFASQTVVIDKNGKLYNVHECIGIYA